MVGLIVTVKLRLLSFHKISQLAHLPFPLHPLVIPAPAGIFCQPTSDAARAVGAARVSSWRVSLANVVVRRAYFLGPRDREGQCRAQSNQWLG